MEMIILDIILDKNNFSDSLTYFAILIAFFAALCIALR